MIELNSYVSTSNSYVSTHTLCLGRICRPQIISCVDLNNPEATCLNTLVDVSTWKQMCRHIKWKFMQFKNSPSICWPVWMHVSIWDLKKLPTLKVSYMCRPETRMWRHMQWKTMQKWFFNYLDQFQYAFWWFLRPIMQSGATRHMDTIYFTEVPSCPGFNIIQNTFEAKSYSQSPPFWWWQNMRRYISCNSQNLPQTLCFPSSSRICLSPFENIKKKIATG